MLLFLSCISLSWPLLLHLHRWPSESKASFITSLASVGGVLLQKHSGFKQACQLDMPRPTQPHNHTFLATWSSGIHLQTALAGQRYTHPKTPCYTKERWTGDSSGYMQQVIGCFRYLKFSFQTTHLPFICFPDLMKDPHKQIQEKKKIIFTSPT